MVFRLTYRLSSEDVDRIVDPKGLVELLEKVLVDAPKPPKRVSLEYEGSWFGVMPAYGPGYYSVKIVGVYPENPSRGLPLVRGLLLLVNSRSGDVLLEADAGPATGWRTAAATVAALKLMGYSGGVLGVIGAGVQAGYHVRVIRDVLGFDKLLVHDKVEVKAESLALKYGGSKVDLRRLLESSDVIVAATTSRDPVVLGNFVKSGTLIASIGAPKPVRELDEEVVRRSRCLLVDSVEGVKAESEEWGPASQLIELAEALRGVKCEWGDVRVYKSVGYSLLDLAIALHLYERARGAG